MKKLLLTLLLVSGLQAATKKKDPTSLEQLWSSSAPWMREYLIDVCADLPGQKVAKQQIMKHQELLGKSLSPYYGEKVAQEFTRLLNEQGRLTINLINAAYKADEKALKESQIAWKTNACVLSTFLSKTNPYITFQILRNMLYDYLALLVDMFTDRVNKKWEEDSQDYDKTLMAWNENFEKTWPRFKDEYGERFYRSARR